MRVFSCACSLSVCVYARVPWIEQLVAAAASSSAVQGPPPFFSKTDSKRGAVWSLTVQRARKPAQAQKP